MLDPKNINIKRMTITCLPLFYLAKKASLVYTDQVDTAGVTKEGTIYLNLEFVEKLARESDCNEEYILEKIIYHELLHVLYRHHTRFPEMTDKANIATDCEINTALLAKDQTALSQVACTPSKYGLPDFKSAEFYFFNLKDEGKEKNDKSSTSDPGSLGTIINKRQEEALRAKIKNKTGEEPQQGKISEEDIAKGWSVNKNLSPQERLVEPKNERPVSLNELVIPLLHKFVGGHAKMSSWTRPSRRIYDDKHFFKGVVRRKDRILLAFDVSGSIPVEKAIKAAYIAKSVIKKLEQEVDYCAFDTEVHEIKRNRRTFDFKYTGGGTDGLAVIDKFKKGNWQKLIIFTDGECAWGKPDKRVLIMRVGQGSQTPYQEFDLEPFFKELNDING